jgi:hypothetical protein
LAIKIETIVSGPCPKSDEVYESGRSEPLHFTSAVTLPAAGFALSQVADEEFYSARLTAIWD